MPQNLSKPPLELFLEDVVVPNWDKTQVRGYDVTAGRGTDAHLPLARSIDDVGAHYPSLIVSPSQPGASGGTTTYDYLTTSGPGQQRNGTFVATVRAEDERDYVGDSSTYSAVDASRITEEIIEHLEDICQSNAQGGGTDLAYIGSHRPSEIPDDTDPTPTVRLAGATVTFGWQRDP